MPKKSENEVRKRIESSGSPHNIQQLCLDGIQIKFITPTIKKLLEGCTNLSYLTLNDCRLQSLQHFPHLKNLVALQITDNKLTGNDLSRLCHSPGISYLMLDTNLIKSISVLAQLTPLTELEILQIHDNEICEVNNYRQSIFEMFPRLNIVDFYDRNNNLVEQEYSQQQYISDIGDSRMEMLDLLDDGSQKDINDLANIAIGRISNDNLKRRYSLETAPSPQQNQITFKSNSFIGAFQRQQEIMMRAAQSYEQSSDQEDELMREFKRKMNKKQQQ